MKINFSLIFFTIAITATCFYCVPKKELVYLQDIEDGAGYELKEDLYVLKKKDVLSVKISTFTTLTDINRYADADARNNFQPILDGYTIGEDGTIDLPVIGKVVLEELTLDEARNKVSELANEYFRNASVRIHLLSFNISVLGEVSRPGRFTVYNPTTTLLEGLALGGDVLPTADRTLVLLLRKSGDEVKTYKFNLLNKEFLSSEQFFLRPDDTIYVSPDRFRNINPLAPISLAISGLSLLVVILNTLVLD